MSDSPRSFSADEWSSLRSQLLRFLPEDSLANLAAKLGRWWSGLFGGKTVYVIVMGARGRRLIGCRAEQGKCLIRETEAAFPHRWGSPDILRLFPEQTLYASEDIQRETSDWQSYLFARGGHCRGGLVVESFTLKALSLKDDLRELGVSCARVIEQVQLADRGEQAMLPDSLILPDADKLEALAEFAAGAGHEINNPAAIIAGRVQLLLRGIDDPEQRRALQTIGAQARRIHEMIGDAMLFARPPKPELQAVRLDELVRETLEKFQGQATEIGCALRLSPAPPISLQADRSQLAVLISQLLRNSLNAARQGTLISLELSSGRDPLGLLPQSSLAILTVEDNGAGLSSMDCRHLFDPFYSGRQAGRGLGFGLSKCWRIVQLHHGRIQAETRRPEGARFRVYLPLEQPST